LSFVKADVSITGAIWAVKGQPDLLKDVQLEARLHEEALTMHLLGKNRRNIFTPHRVMIETESGDPLRTRNDPRASFQGHRQETPWDDLHVAYFANYALWTYLTIPFLYTYPGFGCEGSSMIDFPIAALALYLDKVQVDKRVLHQAETAATKNPWLQRN
jgi:hypothetical protein